MTRPLINPRGDRHSQLTSQPRVAVDAAFPSGNILVDEVIGTHVRLHQDLRDTEGDWFYWCFRVRGAAGRTLDVEFTGSQVIASAGPAASFDGGATWQWLGLDRVRDLRALVAHSLIRGAAARRAVFLIHKQHGRAPQRGRSCRRF